MCGQMRYAKPLHTALPKAGINWALISSGKVKALLDGSRRLAERPYHRRISATVIRLTITPCIYLMLTRSPAAFFRALMHFGLILVCVDRQ